VSFDDTAVGEPQRPPAAGGPRRNSIWSRLYQGETDFQIVRRARLWFVLSGVIILMGLVSLVTRELNMGIDFRGGSVWTVPLGKTDVSVGDARDALAPLGLDDAKIQTLSPAGGGTRTLRVQGDVATPSALDDVTETLAGLAQVDAGDISATTVGPSWGDEVTNKARRALIFFFVAITLYITLRFEWKMAVAGLAAVVHDILVTVGVYSVFGFEVTPATVIAFLTILGYSLYDTIVVFDKVEENTRGLAASGRMTYGDTVNLSMNQVLMRSLNTSVTALLPVISLLVVGALILGAKTLQEFALALLIGLLTGAYSSIFIASPLLALVKEREPRYAAIRDRLEARGLTRASSELLTPAGAGLPAEPGPIRPGDADRRPPRPGPAPATGPLAPRPRKKGRRR
jgi:preprotein translocase subunit SecF